MSATKRTSLGGLLRTAKRARQEKGDNDEPKRESKQEEAKVDDAAAAAARL